MEGNPDEAISPYLMFNVDGKLYYFTPGGFLYRRDPGTEEVGGFFCGYLTEEVWHYRTWLEEEHHRTCLEEEGTEEPAEEAGRSWWRRLFGG